MIRTGGFRRNGFILPKKPPTATAAGGSRCVWFDGARRFPAIHQPNPRRYGPISAADQMRRTRAPCCQARSITLAQGPKDPNAVPVAIAQIAFSSVRPRRVRVRGSSSSSVPSGGDCGTTIGAFRSHWQTALLAQPIRFRRGRSSSRRAARVMAASRFFGKPLVAIARAWRWWRCMARCRWLRRGWHRPGLVGWWFAVGRGFGIPVGFPGGPGVI